MTILIYTNITMKYEYCSKIPFIMFWTDIARFLQYFRNLSNSFINILAILQDFNEIFFKYYLNITVLCRWEVIDSLHVSYITFLLHHCFYWIISGSQ